MFKTFRENRTNTSPAGQNDKHSFFLSILQPKLTINQPNEVYEQEADAMADRVMRMKDYEKMQPPFFRPRVSSLQRKCAHCKEEEKNIQRKEAATNHELESYVDRLNGGGQALSDKVRNFYEPRFGYDFSQVKVHTDNVAAKSAQSINALAYTTGNTIVFNEGQYLPDTDSGKKLLGHELTHVVQQNDQSKNSIQSKYIQRAPTISVVDENFIGPLTQSQRRAVASCPIRCSAANVGTLHAMGLFYHQSRTGVRDAPTATDNGVGTALHFISSGPQASCPCDSFKIIQIITTTHPAAGRSGTGYVDNAGTNTPFYSDVYTSGEGEHTISMPIDFRDKGERITTTHSIYDAPYRSTSGVNTTITWQAEACVACIHNAAPDIILGGLSYGFRIPYDTTTNSFGTVEGIGPYCLYTATSNFERTLRSDPTTSTYDFQVEYGPGDFEISEAVKHMA